MLKEELKKVAELLVSEGKGILAADEPIEYMEKVLTSIGLSSNAENRRIYRQLLFTTDKKLAKYISGIILLPETISQKSDKGVPFVKILKEKGILPGVNVDEGLVHLIGTNNETITKGLDSLRGLYSHVINKQEGTQDLRRILNNLRCKRLWNSIKQSINCERCKKYKRDGCAFAKWRCALKITNDTPSVLAIKENANVLARYSVICQANGLVPIVEPEVQLEGDHDLKKAKQVAEVVLFCVYKALFDYGVYVEGTVLKTAMVMPGRSYSGTCSLEEIGRTTVEVLSRTVPAAVPGIGFLSGGLSADEATEALSAINRHKGKMPWALTFTFGRALQESVAKIWGGESKNVEKAQAELLRRAELNSNATLQR